MLFLGEGWIHKMQIVEHFREFVWLPPPPSTRTSLGMATGWIRSWKNTEKVSTWWEMSSFGSSCNLHRGGSFKHNLKGKDIMETKMRMCVLVRLRVQAAWHLTMNRSPMSRLSLLLRMLNANHGGDKKWQVHQAGTQIATSAHHGDVRVVYMSRDVIDVADATKHGAATPFAGYMHTQIWLQQWNNPLQYRRLLLFPISWQTCMLFLSLKFLVTGFHTFLLLCIFSQAKQRFCDMNVFFLISWIFLSNLWLHGHWKMLQW